MLYKYTHTVDYSTHMTYYGPWPQNNNRLLTKWFVYCSTTGCLFCLSIGGVNWHAAGKSTCLFFRTKKKRNKQNAQTAYRNLLPNALGSSSYTIQKHNTSTLLYTLTSTSSLMGSVSAEVWMHWFAMKWSHTLQHGPWS